MMGLMISWLAETVVLVLGWKKRLPTLWISRTCVDEQYDVLDMMRCPRGRRGRRGRWGTTAPIFGHGGCEQAKQLVLLKSKCFEFQSGLSRAFQKCISNCTVCGGGWWWWWVVMGDDGGGLWWVMMVVGCGGDGWWWWVVVVMGDGGWWWVMVGCGGGGWWW